jgi:hypothetical protein
MSRPPSRTAGASHLSGLRTPATAVAAALGTSAGSGAPLAARASARKRDTLAAELERGAFYLPNSLCSKHGT